MFTLSLGQAEDGTGGVGIEATVQHDFACLNISVQEGGAEVRKWSLPIYETGVGPLLITWNDDTKVLCFNNAMSFHLPDATIDRYASWNFANETKILNWEYGAGASDATPGCATCTGTTCDPESPCAADSLGNLTFLDADGNGTDGGVFETSATVPPEGATESQNGASMTLSGYGGDYNGNGSEDGPSGIAIRYFRVTNCTDITIDASATDAALTCTVEQICSAEEISSGSFGVSVSGETGPASLTVTVPPGFYRAITSGIGTGNGSSTVSGSIDEVGPCS
ncbi:MAG TPA: hypothetical protein VG713_06925 [Pirellulales bacterium]|nr:hypothetical protein [Pirellulales bacterium]